MKKGFFIVFLFISPIVQLSAQPNGTVLCLIAEVPVSNGQYELRWVQDRLIVAGNTSYIMTKSGEILNSWSAGMPVKKAAISTSGLVAMISETDSLVTLKLFQEGTPLWTKRFANTSFADMWWDDNNLFMSGYRFEKKTKTEGGLTWEEYVPVGFIVTYTPSGLLTNNITIGEYRTVFEPNYSPDGSKYIEVEWLIKEIEIGGQENQTLTWHALAFEGFEIYVYKNNGQLIWKREFSDEENMKKAVWSRDGSKIAIWIGNRIYCFDSNTGSILWDALAPDCKGKTGEWGANNLLAVCSAAWNDDRTLLAVFQRLYILDNEGDLRWSYYSRKYASSIHIWAIATVSFDIEGPAQIQQGRDLNIRLRVNHNVDIPINLSFVVHLDGFFKEKKYAVVSDGSFLNFTIKEISLGEHVVTIFLKDEYATTIPAFVLNRSISVSVTPAPTVTTPPPSTPPPTTPAPTTPPPTRPATPTPTPSPTPKPTFKWLYIGMGALIGAVVTIAILLFLARE